MIPVSVYIHAYFMTQYFIIFFDHHPIPQLRAYKCTLDAAFVNSFLDIVFDLYVRGGGGKENATKYA